MKRFYILTLILLYTPLSVFTMGDKDTKSTLELALQTKQAHEPAVVAAAAACGALGASSAAILVSKHNATKEKRKVVSYSRRKHQEELIKICLANRAMLQIDHEDDDADENSPLTEKDVEHFLKKITDSENEMDGGNDIDVLKIDGKVAGFMAHEQIPVNSCTGDQDVVLINYFAIGDGFQRNGHATAFFEKMKRTFKRNRARKIEFSTFKNNLKANYWCKKVGFKLAPQQVNEDTHLYEIELSPQPKNDEPHTAGAGAQSSN